jgi:hypothetical protein
LEKVGISELGRALICGRRIDIIAKGVESRLNIYRPALTAERQTVFESEMVKEKNEPIKSKSYRDNLGVAGTRLRGQFIATKRKTKMVSGHWNIV